MSTSLCLGSKPEWLPPIQGHSTFQCHRDRVWGESQLKDKLNLESTYQDMLQEGLGGSIPELWVTKLRGPWLHTKSNKNQPQWWGFNSATYKMPWHLPSPWNFPLSPRGQQGRILIPFVKWRNWVSNRCGDSVSQRPILEVGGWILAPKDIQVIVSGTCKCCTPKETLQMWLNLGSWEEEMILDLLDGP